MNKRPFIVGITGGIGAGKSTVCKVLEYLKVPVYYADQESKLLVNRDEIIIEAIKHNFGESLYSEGKLDNKGLSKVVFNDPAKLEILNGIIHPQVKLHFLNWVRDQSAPYVVKEAAILYESGSHIDCDRVISVYAPIEVRVKRAMERDSLTQEEVLARIAKQMNEEEKRDRADYVIFNNGEEMILPQVVDLHHNLLEGAKK